MKYILICLLATISIYIGYSFSRKYVKRAKFFQELVMLCNKFEIEINYSRERLKNLFLSLDQKQQASLQGIDKNFIDFLEGQKQLEKEDLFKNISFLKDNEKDAIFLFFKALGRSDAESQSKEIKNYRTKFEEFALSASNDNKKYGSMSFKLGIVCALLVSILIL